MITLSSFHFLLTKTFVICFSRPKDVVKIFLLAEGKQVRLKAEIIQDFSNYFKVFMASSSSPTFGVVRGNPYSKLLKSFPKYQVEDTTLRRDATFRMARTVKAIVKAKIETVTSQVRSFFLVYLDRYDPGESAELILKPNSPEEMEGRAIDLLVLSKLNSSTDDYINQLLEQESKKHFIDQQVNRSVSKQLVRLFINNQSMIINKNNIL